MKIFLFLITLLFSSCQGVPVTVGIEYQGINLSVTTGGKEPVQVEGKSPALPEPTSEKFRPINDAGPDGTMLDSLKPETGSSNMFQKMMNLFR